MQVIESIKLIFNSPNCIFFLGCDTAYLESAIYSNHKELILEHRSAEENDKYINNFAREYLEKIIQIPFYIPPITKESIKEYVNSILFDNNIKTENSISIDENLYKTFIKGLGDDFISEMIVIVDLNPRRIKRILNLIFLNYTFLRFKNKKDILFKVDIKLLSLLVIAREVFPKYYKSNLSSESDCNRIFNSFFQKYCDEAKGELENYEDEGVVRGRNEEEEIVFDLFKKYFEVSQINDEKINKILKNIIQYITVSSTMVESSYDTIKWGEIGELKADTNGKKLKFFLDKIYNNEAAKEIVLWFFKEIYSEKENKYAFGLVQNIPVYKKDGSGLFDYKKDLLFRFEFQNDKDILYVNLEGKGAIKSIIKLQKHYIYTDKYNEEEKKIVVNNKVDNDEVDKIKRTIKAMIESVDESY